MANFFQDEYRSMQDGLLAWMRAVEREKLALNLRHVRVGGGGVERALAKVEVGYGKVQHTYKAKRSGKRTKNGLDGENFNLKSST